MVAVAGARELAEARRHHLAALAYELEARRLRWRLDGPEESVLRVAHPASRRQAMVVATPTGDRWSYLWTGGGIAEVGAPGPVAEQILKLLA